MSSCLCCLALPAPAIPQPAEEHSSQCLVQNACALFVSFGVCCSEGTLCACQAAANPLVPQDKLIPVVPLTIPVLDALHSQEDGAWKCCRGMDIGLSRYSLSSSLSQQTCCLPGRNRGNNQQSGQEGRTGFVQQLLLSCLTAAAFLGQQMTVPVPVWSGVADILLEGALSSRYI